jgi:hypothetical protein
VYLPIKPTFPVKLNELLKRAQSLDCGGAGFYIDDPSLSAPAAVMTEIGHGASELPSLHHRKTGFLGSETPEYPLFFARSARLCFRIPFFISRVRLH